MISLPWHKVDGIIIFKSAILSHAIFCVPFPLHVCNVGVRTCIMAPVIS